MTILDLLKLNSIFKKPKKKSVIRQLMDCPENFEIIGRIENDDILIRIRKIEESD